MLHVFCTPLRKLPMTLILKKSTQNLNRLLMSTFPFWSFRNRKLKIYLARTVKILSVFHELSTAMNCLPLWFMPKALSRCFQMQDSRLRVSKSNRVLEQWRVLMQILFRILRLQTRPPILLPAPVANQIVLRGMKLIVVTLLSDTFRYTKIIKIIQFRL